MSVFANENAVTGALSELLRGSPAAQACFLRLIWSPQAPPAFTGSLEIFFRSRTDSGQEIDLLLVNGSNAIIAECKVGDSQKVYQLEGYRDFWLRTRGTKPVLVWLVRQPQQMIGMRELGAHTLTWTQLHDSLQTAAAGVEGREKKAITAFCAGLSASDLLLSGDAAIEKKKRYLGYDPDHAWRVLDRIGKSIDGFRYRPVQMNELNLALHGGLMKWASSVGDTWQSRVILYFKPDGRQHLVRSPYFFHGQLILYHVRSAPEPDAHSAAVSDWIGKCRRGGLEMWRNRPLKWKGRVPIPPWAHLDGPVKYVYGEVPEQQARSRYPFDWQSDDEAIRSGALQLRQLLELASRIWGTGREGFRNPTHAVCLPPDKRNRSKA